MSKKKHNKSQKKAQFTQSKKPSYAALYFGIAAIAAVVVLVVGYYSLSGGSKTSALSARTSSGIDRKKVADAVTYDSNLEMTDVGATVENGKLVASLDDVIKNKMVGFTYDKNTVDTGLGPQPLPLIAYINGKGELITAVAMCEPCKSIRFHAEPDGTLTCNACGTKWSIDTLEPVSGACTRYPPDEVKYEVKDGKILIDESEIKDWKSRV